MRTLIRSLALFLALQPALVAAQTPNTPQTLPANTVVGRLGINAGPAQAIPFARFQAAISGPCATATAGLVPATGGGTANFLRADCTFANPTPAIANNNVLANISGGSAAATATTPSGLWNSFCSTTIGNIWVRLSSAWGCTALGFANPVWWGADPTGAADSAAAFNSAIATGLPIRWPGGTFKISSLISTTLANGAACFCMQGAGSNLTVLNWPNASGGIAITAANILNNVNISGIHLTTSQTNSGTAISMAGVGSNSNPWTNFDDVLITGDDFTGSAGTHYWAIGWNLNNWGDINVFRSNFFGQITGGVGGGVGIQYGGKIATTSYATVLNVQSSSFNFANPGISLQSYWQGVYINDINCNGISGGACILQGGSASGGLALLSVTGSQMNAKGNQIDINTGIASVLIQNNTITCSNNNCTGINLGTSFHSVITGNFFNLSGSPTGTIAVGSNGTNGVFVGNVVTQMATGVFLQGSSANWTVGLNAYGSVGTKVSNSGTGNSVGTAAAGNMTGVVP